MALHYQYGGVVQEPDGGVGAGLERHLSTTKHVFHENCLSCVEENGDDPVVGYRDILRALDLGEFCADRDLVRHMDVFADLIQGAGLTRNVPPYLRLAEGIEALRSTIDLVLAPAPGGDAHS